MNSRSISEKICDIAQAFAMCFVAFILGLISVLFAAWIFGGIYMCLTGQPYIKDHNLKTVQVDKDGKPVQCDVKK